MPSRGVSQTVWLKDCDTTGNPSANAVGVLVGATPTVTLAVSATPPA
ncbi:hypothetical protein KRR26_34320 [Corallococcus sp. M34]|nr:hypothetical protein [Citreicoccus inhibens]MBU8900696.1 hypothetical protein [Citreicoccus inhibens]